MKEIVEYTLAIIEAAWPVIIFVGLIIGLVLHWFLPKQLDIEPLTEYFDPPPKQEEKEERKPFYCEKCKKESIYYSICDTSNCKEESPEPYAFVYDEKRDKYNKQFCQCSLSKDLADYHGKDVPCPQCKKMTNHKSNALN